MRFCRLPRKGESITISVTAQHIALGVPKSSHRCPLALALREKYPRWSQRISVGPGEVHLMRIRRWQRELGTIAFTLDEKARQFVSDFDQGPYQESPPGPQDVTLTRI
jgi:hypothetical protein